MQTAMMERPFFYVTPICCWTDGWNIVTCTHNHVSTNDIAGLRVLVTPDLPLSVHVVKTDRLC